MVCPICKQQLSENVVFCSQCGFELHILPNNVSDKVRKYEKSREEQYKNTWEEANKSFAKVNEIKKKLQSKEEELNKRTTSYQSEIDILNNKTKLFQKEIDDLNKENKSYKEMKIQLENQHRKQTNILQQKIDDLANTNNKISQEISNLQFKSETLEQCLKDVTNEKERLERLVRQNAGNTGSVKSNTQQTSSKLQNIGTVRFIDGAKIENRELFLDNTYNYRGCSFVAREINGRLKFILIGGNIKNSNGTSINNNGSTIIDGERFILNDSIIIEFIINKKKY
ncbi:MAG: hypothetical protein IKA83_00565 [Paludibacteraceae bacterium]|nr:hypothetical protein [Paludibacteraceae bacterium]